MVAMTKQEIMPMSLYDNSINKLTFNNCLQLKLKHNAVKKKTKSHLNAIHFKRPFKKRLQWSKQAMLDAMKAIQDGSPITTAARVHGVPKTSLHNRIKGRVIHRVKPGPKQYLSVEEEIELAEFEAASVGCGQTQKQIMTIAENVARIKVSRISQGWYEKFMKRQTYLSICKGDPAANEMAVTSQAIT